jgi:general secretion pathway protein J
MPARCAGFALLELLVALALLGLIVAMVSGSLRSAARLTAASELRLAGNARIESVQTVLRRQLEGMLPLELPAAPDGMAPLFAGDAGALRWAARPPSALLPAGLYLAQLAIEPASDPAAGGVLLARWQPLDPARPLAEQAAGAGTTTRLVDGVGALRLRYFGQKGQAAPAWHADWQGERRLPSLISLELAPADGAAWRWPPMLVAPRLGPAASSPASSSAAAE